MVKMELGASSAQANSVSSMSASRVAGYQAAMTSLNSFSASDSLSGNAYDNAKAYATGILVPLMQGGILLSQGIAKAAAKLPADYVSEVAPESLDSEVLEEQIAHQKALLASAEAQFKSASKLKDPIAKQETQLRAGQSMARLNAKINELEEKLEKLLAFDGASAKIFSELADLKQAVDQGLAMVTSDFKGASSIPTIKGRSLPWVKTINASVAKFSDDGEEELSNIQKKVLKDALSNYVKAGVLSKQEADAIESLPPNKWDMLINGLNQTKTGVKLGDVLENTFFEGIGSLAEGAIEKLTEAGFVPAFIKSSAIALEKASPIVKQWIQQKGLTALLATSIGSYANDVPTGIGNVVMDGIESMTMEGIKFADDLADDAVGKISGHIVSGPITLGVSAVQAWLSDEVTFGEAVAGNIGGMVTAAGLTVVLSAVGVTFAPISIGAVAVGVAGAMIFNEAYEKIEWVKDGTDFVSDKIDESVSAIGDVFQDSWKSIKNWAT